jgi:hypothetical protein
LALRVIAEAPGWTRAVAVTDAAPDEMTLRLRRGVKVAGRVTAVRGRRLVAGATVTVVTEGSRGSAITDQDGEYVVADVQPGPATVIVRHAGYAESRLEATVERTARPDRAFELAEVDLKEPASVRGIVVDVDDRPVPGARVAEGVAPAYLPAGTLPASMALTDARGSFEIPGLEPGTLSFEAYAPGVGRGRLEGVEVRADRPTEGLRLKLEGETSDNDPATGATVALTLGQLKSTGDASQVGIVVVHVADGSDAERNGVARGDRIARIDGRVPQSLDEARRRLSGAQGSNVLVEFDREGTTLTLRLLREQVRR